MRKTTINEFGVISLKTVAIIVVFLLIVGGMIGLFLFFNPPPSDPCSRDDITSFPLVSGGTRWHIEGQQKPYIEHQPEGRDGNGVLVWVLVTGFPPSSDIWTVNLKDLLDFVNSEIRNPFRDVRQQERDVLRDARDIINCIPRR